MTNSKKTPNEKTKNHIEVDCDFAPKKVVLTITSEKNMSFGQLGGAIIKALENAILMTCERPMSVEEIFRELDNAVSEIKSMLVAQVLKEESENDNTTT